MSGPGARSGSAAAATHPAAAAQQLVRLQCGHVKTQIGQRQCELTAARTEVEDAAVLRALAANETEQIAVVVLGLAHHFEVVDAAVRLLRIRIIRRAASAVRTASRSTPRS